ncbi:MAG: MFS transporter [Chloroflexota bacterium]
MTEGSRSDRSVWAPSQRVLTVGLIGLVTAVAFEGMAVPTILPAMVAELGQLELYGWAFSAFWLTNIIGITLGGGDADRHGPGRAFGLGALLFAAGLVVSAMATSMPIVIVGRAVQGFGSGALGAVVYVVIARGYGPSAIPRMIAFLSSAWVVPGLVGPAAAGLVAEQLSWRWVFAGLAPAVLLMALAVLRPIADLGRSEDALAPHEGTGRGRRAVDALRLALGSSALLAGLSARQPIVVAALLVIGSWLSLGALRRLLPEGSLAARPGRPAVVALMFLVAFAFFGTEAFVPLAVTAVRGASTVVGGLALSAAAVTWALGSWLPARLASRSLRRQLVGGGAGLVAAGIALTALVLLPTLPIAMAAVGWAVAGLGMGLAYSTLSLLILETAAPGQEGTSSSALQLMFTLGTALGAGAGGALIALSEAGLYSLGTAIALADGVMVAAALLVALLARRVPARAPSPTAGRHERRVASPAGAVGLAEES